MAGTAREVSKAQLRRVVLASSFVPTVEELGYVQLDSINAVARAHDLILWARNPRYQQEDWLKLLRRGEVFEHWTHDAAIIPVQFYPYWHDRFVHEAVRIQSSKWWQERLGKSDLERVLKRIEEEGPLQAKDFKSEDHTAGGWWNWKPEKAALEYLWRTGKLAVVDRVHFHKVYDLASRHLGHWALDEPPSRAEIVDWACREGLKRMGAATAAELAAFWRLVSPGEAKTWLEQRPHHQDWQGKPVWLADDWEERFDRWDGKRLRLLAPFDPVVRDRKRCERLFDFRFRFEAFVPKAQREHGYYTLVAQYGDSLVARVTPKLHRKKSLLEISKIHWETRPVTAKLKQELERLRRFLGAQSMIVE